uniref:Uncharacterized protein n=1 Tax=Rhizophora mucronata TaxID=61149 RepID=A0A2P2R1J7_RHIMU
MKFPYSTSFQKLFLSFKVTKIDSNGMATTLGLGSHEKSITTTKRKNLITWKLVS